MYIYVYMYICIYIYLYIACGSLSHSLSAVCPAVFQFLHMSVPNCI